ncbi:MAG: DUF362 domain-containing protein [Armatimonadetes bacterium]|nr:DUF362 domain-containing protein [Armatimonadota bacterium]
MTRRDFLRQAASAAAAAALGLPALAADEKTKTSTVVLIRHPDAVSADGRVNAAVVAQMIDEAVAKLVGTSRARDAWPRLIKPTDTVGIKSNEWAPLRTPPEVEQILRQRCIDVGVPAERIKITDRQARTLLADCTALINVRPVRSHHWAGIGGCIKNYIMFSDRPSQYHPNSCESLALAWELPICKGKTRLNILLALTPLFWGRGPHHYDPNFVWPYRGIFVSFDPVAVDALGAELLRRKRIDFFGEDRPITPTVHITAAGEKYGLGVADLSRIRLIKLGWQEGALL